LPKRQRLIKGHHKAMLFDRVPEFMKKLRTNDSPAAKALELTVLCATRTSETLKADWREIDPNKKLWTIAAGRMKASKEHRTTLSHPAVKLLEAMPTFANGFLHQPPRAESSSP
ncbi:MAG TPA: tyrosine-type recombinase/integrase, partial [Phenylobacterium sp.]